MLCNRDVYLKGTSGSKLCNMAGALGRCSALHDLLLFLCTFVLASGHDDIGSPPAEPNCKSQDVHVMIY